MLLKCFLPTKKGAFDNECKILETLSRGKNKSGLPFLELRAKADFLNVSSAVVELPTSGENISVLCFSFVDGISLLNWTKSNDSSENLDLAYQFAYDVISALEFLHGNGINHNDITPANILLIKKPGMPPWKAMLINFDRASKEASHATDLKAFCHLLRWMTEQCISENGEVKSSFHEWLDGTAEENLTASLLRQQLEMSREMYFMDTRL